MVHIAAGYGMARADGQCHSAVRQCISGGTGRYNGVPAGIGGGFVSFAVAPVLRIIGALSVYFRSYLMYLLVNFKLFSYTPYSSHIDRLPLAAILNE